MPAFKHGGAGSQIVFFGGLLLVVWSFFSAPGKLLYLRYFEASTIFNPGWTLHTYLAGWSYQWHLGAANNTEISYVAPLSLALCALSAWLGPVAASVIYPAAISAFGYWAFVWYAASKLRSSPIVACIAGVFYVTNPAWILFVHEGYSGILFDWALIPFCLRLIDIAEERNESLILAIPFIFIAGEMFQYPQVAIDWAVLILLRFRVLYRMVSRDRYLSWGLLAGLAANLYWIFPMAVYLKTHTALPILSETRSDIKSYAEYSSFVNVALLRALPPMWTTAYGGIRECSSCDFYATAYYSVATVIVIVAAAAGLWLKRWYGLFIIAAVALVLATGYHYAGTLLAWPYAFLMALPLHGIFRSAGLFLSVATFAYALGFGAALDVLWSRQALVRLASGVVACALLFATGYLALSGRWIERGIARDGILFPNFPVAFPSDGYDAARKKVLALAAPDRSVTLLAPAMPYADYRWGAYGNDFLYAYFGTPALFEWYWPQDNFNVQNGLDYVLTQNDPFSIATSLEAMRIGAVFVHGDVWGHPNALESASRYGRVVWQRRALAVAAPRFAPLPLLQFSHAPMMTFGFRDAMRLSSGFHRAVFDRGEGAVADCSAPYDIAWGRMSSPITAATSVVVSFPISCARQSFVEIRSEGSGALALSTRPITGGAVTGVPLTRALDSSGVSVWTGRVTDPAGTNLIISTPQGSSVNVYGIELRSVQTAARDEAGTFAPWMGVAQVLNVPAHTSAVVINESYDSSWAVYALCNSGPMALAHASVNGYANGFATKGCRRFAIVNWAQASFVGGVAAGLLATIAAIYFWYLAMASKVKRSSLAAAVPQAN